MTELLYLDDAYATTATATVTAWTGDALILDRTVFYPAGGGQAGDRGWLRWDGDGGVCGIVDTVKGEGGAVLLIPGSDALLPPANAPVEQTIDWDRRYRMMRLHTALHLLSVVIPLPVTGGQITPEKGRLDFDMPEPPEDPGAVAAALNALVAADHTVSETWITDEELAANPGLVKTMSVRPPTGRGRVRLVRIGPVDAPVDLQPCGGTHVRSTGEIGPLVLGKIEKKGRRNRRVTVLLG